MAEHKTDTLGSVSVAYKSEFDRFMFNDIGTPQAIALIWKLLKDESISNEDKYATILSFDEVLGLDLKNAKKTEKEVVEVPAGMQILLDARKIAKDNRDFVESDRLRDEIYRLGFVVKDGPNGQEVNRL